MLQCSLCLKQPRLAWNNWEPWATDPELTGKELQLWNMLDTDLQMKGRYSTAFLMFTCSFSTCNLAMQNQRVGREKCLKEGCVLCQGLFSPGRLRESVTPAEHLHFISAQHCEVLVSSMGKTAFLKIPVCVADRLKFGLEFPGLDDCTVLKCNSHKTLVMLGEFP